MKITSYTKQSVILSIAKNYGLFWRQFSKELKKNQCSLMEALILVAIYFEKHEVSPSQIATAINISRPNVSHGLRSLENLMLIERQLDKTDARRNKIALTTSGKKLAQKLVSSINLLEQKCEKQVGSKALSQMLTTLDELSTISIEDQ